MVFVALRLKPKALLDFFCFIWSCLDKKCTFFHFLAFDLAFKYLWPFWFFLDIWWLKSPVIWKNPISKHIFIPNSKRVKFPTSVHSEDMKTNSSTIHIVIFADEYYRSQNHLQIDTMKCYCNKKRLQLHIFGLNNTEECNHSINFHRRHCLLAEIMRTRVYI